MLWFLHKCFCIRQATTSKCCFQYEYLSCREEGNIDDLRKPYLENVGAVKKLSLFIALLKFRHNNRKRIADVYSLW